jgi:hypothetical protein
MKYWLFERETNILVWRNPQTCDPKFLLKGSPWWILLSPNNTWVETFSDWMMPANDSAWTSIAACDWSVILVQTSNTWNHGIKYLTSSSLWRHSLPWVQSRLTKKDFSCLFLQGMEFDIASKVLDRLNLTVELARFDVHDDKWTMFVILFDD